MEIIIKMSCVNKHLQSNKLYKSIKKTHNKIRNNRIAKHSLKIIISKIATHSLKIRNNKILIQSLKMAIKNFQKHLYGRLLNKENLQIDL